MSAENIDNQLNIANSSGNEIVPRPSTLKMGSNLSKSYDSSDNSVTIDASGGSDTHIDVEVDNVDVQSDASTVDYNAGNAITISSSSDDDDASAVDLTFSVNEGSISHDNIAGVSANDHHDEPSGGDDITLDASNTISLDNTIGIDEIRSESDDVLQIRDSIGDDNAEVESHIFRASDQVETGMLSPLSGDFIDFENSTGSPGNGGIGIAKIETPSGALDIQDSSNNSAAGNLQAINTFRGHGFADVNLGNSPPTVSVSSDFKIGTVSRDDPGEYTVTLDNAASSATDVNIGFTSVVDDASVSEPTWTVPCVEHSTSSSVKVLFIGSGGTKTDPPGFIIHYALK